MKRLLLLFLLIPLIVNCQTFEKYKHVYQSQSGIIKVQFSGNGSRMYIVDIRDFDPKCSDQCIDCLNSCYGQKFNRQLVIQNLEEKPYTLKLDVPEGQYVIRVYYASPLDNNRLDCPITRQVVVANPSKYISLTQQRI